MKNLGVIGFFCYMHPNADPKHLWYVVTYFVNPASGINDSKCAYGRTKWSAIIKLRKYLKINKYTGILRPIK